MWLGVRGGRRAAIERAGKQHWETYNGAFFSAI